MRSASRANARVDLLCGALSQRVPSKIAASSTAFEQRRRRPPGLGPTLVRFPLFPLRDALKRVTTFSRGYAFDHSFVPLGNFSPPDCRSSPPRSAMDPAERSAPGWACTAYWKRFQYIRVKFSETPGKPPPIADRRMLFTELSEARLLRALTGAKAGWRTYIRVCCIVFWC